MWIIIVFFSSISLVRISYKTIWLKTGLDIKPTEKWKPEELKFVFSKRCASKIWGGGVSEVRFKRTRLFRLGNVEKPPHPQFAVQRALNYKILITIYSQIQVIPAYNTAGWVGQSERLIRFRNWADFQQKKAVMRRILTGIFRIRSKSSTTIIEGSG